MIGEGYGSPNPGGVGFPDPGQFMCVRLDDLRRHSEGKFTSKNKRGTWSDAWKALSGPRGVLCIASDLVWRTDKKIKR